MNQNVVNFFAVGTVTLGFLGWRFAANPAPVFRMFGIGLGLFALSFALFTVIVRVHPAELETWSSVAVLPFVAGYFFHIGAATFDWLPRKRMLVMAIAAVFLTGLYLMRTFVYPSTPGFSPNGLYYFHARPPALLLYILAFAGAFMPAVHVVSSHIAKRSLAAMTRICFNLVVLGAVILLTSYDDELQYLNGVVMVFGFLSLLVLYMRNSVNGRPAGQ